ncbi:MAG TPA: threonine/serine exporter family protein, partial [Xanthobacteraceae bacterium]
NGRIHLGAARLIYATLVLVAISTGLLLGLAALGVSLPVDQAGRAVPFWEDVIAAGVAVFAYSVFFSTPLDLLTWPVAVGMMAHALRWGTLVILDTSAATGAFVASAVVGLILTPVAHRWHMPWAAIGFASVVSMMPGSNLFRMASGLLEIAGSTGTSLDLISATIADGVAALTVTLAISFGLLTPKLAIDWLHERTARAAH